MVPLGQGVYILTEKIINHYHVYFSIEQKQKSTPTVDERLYTCHINWFSNMTERPSKA